ncbi:MAG: hypothetical protein LJE95_00950 [Acidobacteria bacterium]|jgi:hypothetical protein|nr:hypothetical protein [Acidobacteriota bacterium]
MKERREFDALEVSEVYCPTCRVAQPVRRHLLLVLPTGNKYEYRCAVCGTPVGGKEDGDASEYNTLLGRASRIIR